MTAASGIDPPRPGHTAHQAAPAHSLSGAALELPTGLIRAAGRLSGKDRQRIADRAMALHRTNSALWRAEDQVRGTTTAQEAADLTQEIGDLNNQRNQQIELLDEVLNLLERSPENGTGGVVPMHTETLGSALDRLSVQTLRLHHTRRAAYRDQLARTRLPAIARQHQALAEAIGHLASDVAAGRRRLPSPPRYKLYAETAGPAAPPTPHPHLEHVVAFAGLSECGKSTSAIWLARHFGTQRLKMGWLLAQAAARHGLCDPYRLSPDRQAELLLEQINSVFDGHRDLRACTIESVHHEDSIRALKRLLGDILQVVYLDVPFEVRVARSGTDAHAVSAKDEVKRSRGAHQVAGFADHVIDNSGSIQHLHARLVALTDAYVRLHPAEHIPVQELPDGAAMSPRAAQATAQLVGELREVGPPVRLAALTGSPYSGPWIDGWSDVDLLVIAAPDVHAPVQCATEAYREALAGTKLGLTLLTPGEVHARRSLHRLVVTWKRINVGQPVLLHSPGFTVPRVSVEDVAEAAIADLPLVFVTLRRLRARADHDPSCLRPLYKHVVTGVRLALYEHLRTPTTVEDVLAADLPGLEVLPLPPLQHVAQAWASGHPDLFLHATVEAADRLLQWYAAQYDLTLTS